MGSEQLPIKEIAIALNFELPKLVHDSKAHLTFKILDTY